MIAIKPLPLAPKLSYFYNMLSTNVLVLNRGYLAIDITTVRRAFSMLYQGIARAVDEQYATFDFKSWADLAVYDHHESIGLVDSAIRIPRVILLQVYDRVPKRQVRFSRHNIYLRDKNVCQYCGYTLARKELNLDHVIPRSRGGMTTWANIVTSCFTCNRRKGGHLLQEVGMKLIRPPRRPRWTPVSVYTHMNGHYREWLPFLNPVDFAYWNVELEED
jgi:5-methylcytosine-specific restriction endonuclease McrA